MPETNLIDVAWTKPSPAAVKAAGYAGVIGYISHDASKDLGAKQAKAYLKAGLRVALVFETTATEAEHNAAVGQADAAYAERRAAAMGYPKACPIFYAVDEDVPGVKVADYFRGMQHAAEHPSGPYGSYDVVEYLTAHGLAPVSWQTAAWSSGRLSSHAHLYQRVGKERPKIAGVAGNTYDEDVVCRPITLWGGQLAPPSKPPVVKPPAKPTRISLRHRVAARVLIRGLSHRHNAVAAPDRPLLAHVQLACTSALGIKETP